MKKQLFEYAVLLHPSSKENENQEPSKIIVEKTTTLATSSEKVAMEAVMSIPAEYKNRLDEIEVVVRPF